MISDGFCMVIWKSTSRELVRNVKEGENIVNVLKYLKRIESEIITQSKVDETICNDKGSHVGQFIKETI